MKQATTSSGLERGDGSVWPLRLLAVMIAAVVWLFASFLPRLERRSEPPIEREIEAQLAYQNPNPEEFMILNKSHLVTVLVRGRAEVVQALDDIDLQVSFPPRFLANEPVEVALSLADVTLPDEVDAVSLTPDRLTLLIDDRERVTLPIRPVVVGEPGGGFTMSDVSWEVTPQFAQVEGPHHQVTEIIEVNTEVINVTGKAITFDQKVELLLDHNYSRVLQPTLVTVRIVFPELGAEPGASLR